MVIIDRLHLLSNASLVLVYEVARGLRILGTWMESSYGLVLAGYGLGEGWLLDVVGKAVLVERILLLAHLLLMRHSFLGVVILHFEFDKKQKI